MKARRIPATPPEVTPTPPCGFRITRHKKMLKMKIATNNSLKIQGLKSAPNKLWKIKGKNKKDVKNEGTSQ
jgi:hypothetical protein